jgi:hypothetical protein
VVKSRERFDARRQELLDETVVEGDALRVRLAGAFGKDARPGDREAVCRDAEGLQEGDVLRIPVVMVVGDVAVLVVLDLPRRMRVGVPDRDSLAVLVPGTFDLVRGGRDAPLEPVRKAAADGRGRRECSCGQ